MHPSPCGDIPADIHVCRPGYALPPDDARDSLPVVASPHQLLIGTPSRSVSTFGFVSVGPARAPSAGVWLLLPWSILCFLLFDSQRIFFLFPFLGETPQYCSHFLPTHIINPLKNHVLLHVRGGHSLQPYSLNITYIPWTLKEQFEEIWRNSSII